MPSLYEKWVYRVSGFTKGRKLQNYVRAWTPTVAKAGVIAVVAGLWMAELRPVMQFIPGYSRKYRVQDGEEDP